VGSAEKVFKVKGQGHSEVRCTFPAEGYPLTCGCPSGGGIPIDGVMLRLTCFCNDFWWKVFV